MKRRKDPRLFQIYRTFIVPFISWKRFFSNTKEEVEKEKKLPVKPREEDSPLSHGEKNKTPEAKKKSRADMEWLPLGLQYTVQASQSLFFPLKNSQRPYKKIKMIMRKKQAFFGQRYIY
jgi:hypothetical protein